VPIVKTFLKNEDVLNKDPINLLESNMTMSEKIKILKEKYIVLVKPNSW
jgi:hypothetical protein